jgi:hypothetical protein
MTTQSRNQREGHYIGTGSNKHHYRDFFGGKRKSLYSHTSVPRNRKQRKAAARAPELCFDIPF